MNNRVPRTARSIGMTVAAVALLCCSCRSAIPPTQSELVQRLKSDSEITYVRTTFRLSEAKYETYVSCLAQAITEQSSTDQARRYVDGSATLKQTPHQWSSERTHACLTAGQRPSGAKATPAG